MKSFLHLILAGLVVTPVISLAQAEVKINEEIANKFAKETFLLQSTSMGLSVKAKRDGEMFKIDDDFKDIVRVCPEALLQYNGYKKNKSKFYWGYLGGFAAALLLAPTVGYNTKSEGAFDAIFLGGLAISVYSIGFEYRAANNLLSCVWEYNKYILSTEE